jgi:hypothetical protein
MPDARAGRKRQIQVTPGPFGGGAAASVPAASIPHPAEQVTPLLFQGFAFDSASAKWAWEAGASNPDIKRHLRSVAKCISIRGLLHFLACWFPGDRQPKRVNDGEGASLRLIYYTCPLYSSSLS